MIHRLARLIWELYIIHGRELGAQDVVWLSSVSLLVLSKHCLPMAMMLE
jgi:hypothetical protein